MTITEANDKVLEAIESVGEGTILGLLPVTRQDQDAIVQAVRAFAQGNLGHLFECLKRCAPATSAFAVALAPSRAMEDGNFFKSFRDELGIDVPYHNREALSEQFQKTCTSLGLPTGTLGALPNLAPILYQSGILPHWVEPLCDAVRRTLRRNPIADPDSIQHMERIRSGIIDRIPPAHLRLLDCMRHETGIHVLRRMLQAAIRRDYSSLPPHLSDRIRGALEGEAPKFLSVPHLAFDPASGALEVVLPRQGEELLNEASAWDVGGRMYTAGSERRLCVTELPGCEVAVRLRHLAGELEDQEFHIGWQFDPAHPFRLFQRRDGRERKRSPAGQSSITAGEYFLLGSPGMQLDGIDFANVTREGAFDWAEIDIRPGAEVRIHVGGAHHTIAARAEPSVAFRCAGVVTTADGERVLHGDGAQADIFFPLPTAAAAIPEIEILASAPPSPGNRRSVTIGAAELHGDSNGVLSQRGTVVLGELIAALPPGIHQLELVVKGSTRRVSATALFWKGLQHISEARGFVCHQPAANMDQARCRGVIFQHDRMAWDPNFHAPFVTLHYNSLRRALEFPRAGISVQVQDRSEDWTETLAPGSTIELAHPENRIVRFVSGGFQDWEIHCGNTSIGTLKSARPQQVISLAGLSGQFGEAGRIAAHRPDGQELHLFSFFKPFVAHDLQVEEDPAYRLHRARFRIGTQRIGGLAVRVSDALKDPPDSATDLCLSIPSQGSDEEITPFEGILSIAVGRGIDGATLEIEVKAPFDAIANRLLVLDFMLRPEDGAELSQIRVSERHGTSSLRLVLPPIEWPEPKDPWQALLRHAATKYANVPELLQPQLGTLDHERLDRFLARTTSILQFKYPSEVWTKSIKWFQEVPILLAANRFNVWDESAKTWAVAAVRELETRSRQTNTAVVSQMLLASVYQLMRAPGHLFENGGNGIIERSFDTAAKIAVARTLVDFARPDAGKSIAFDVYPYFENFAAVNGGGEPDLRRFGWRRFITETKARGERLARSLPRIEVQSLLSPEHMLHAVRRLNRRTRCFREAGHDSDPDHPLRGIKQAILKMHQPFENRVNALREDLGFPAGFGAAFLLPGVENAWCGRVAQLVFLVSGLGRLAGYERRPPQWFEDQAQHLLLHNHLGGAEDRAEKLRNALCILLSLGPEIYAYFHLLWTVALKNGDDE